MSINTKTLTACEDSKLKLLCEEYSDALPGCSVIIPRSRRRRDQNKLMQGRASFLDFFELREGLLKTNQFKFITASWCMFPVFKKGDILKIMPVEPEEIKPGDIPVYRDRDRLYAHRIIDKKIINGKIYVFTRPDTNKESDDIKRSHKIPAEEILGIVKEVKRGRKVRSTEKREPTIWDRILYIKSRTLLKLKSLVLTVLKAILKKAQTFKLYKALGGRFAKRIKACLIFEAAFPLANEKLNRIYRYLPIRDNKEAVLLRIKEVGIFHVVIKYNNIFIGYASFFKRPDSCPYKGIWLSDVYIRLRYQGLGFDSILLEKIREFSKEMKMKDRRLFMKSRPVIFGL